MEEENKRQEPSRASFRSIVPLVFQLATMFEARGVIIGIQQEQWWWPGNNSSVMSIREAAVRGCV